MNEKANPGRTMTRRDRCMRIITTISRAGRDHEIHKALTRVLAWRGLSALTDAAIEDLATRVVATSMPGVFWLQSVSPGPKIMSFTLISIALRARIEGGKRSVGPGLLAVIEG